MVDQKQMVFEWLNASAFWKEGILLFKSIFGAEHPFLILIRKRGSQLKYDILKQALVNFSKSQKNTAAAAAPVLVKPKLREEFTFLNDKDCPSELKVLAADKISAYHRYTTGHTKLFDCSTAQEQYQTVAMVVDSFIENRRILKEFEHYQKHKSILGKHPIFKLFRRIKEFRAMKFIELVKLRKNIDHSIWRVQSEINKGDKPHLLAERLESIKFKKQEIIEIDRILEKHA